MVEGVPSGNVTIDITGSEISSINQTITAQQAQDGYCFSLYGTHSEAGRKSFTVTVAATGGIVESKQFTVYLSEETEEVTRKWTPYLYLIDGICNWRRQYPTFTLSTFEAKRTALKESIFGNDYPSGAPESTAESQASNSNGTTFNVASPIRRRLNFSEEDIEGYTWTKDCYWATNAAASDTLVIDFSGHGEVGHQDLYDAIYSAGYDFASARMPWIGDTVNPDISGTFGGHNSYLTALDRDGYDARRLFFFDKVRMLDYILSQKSYTNVVLTGVSGGGYTASQFAAFYGAGITHVFIQRGTNSNGLFESEPHYEEGPNLSTDWDNEGNVGPRVLAKLKIHSRLDWPMMAVASGAVVHHMTHPDDTVGSYRSWSPQVYGEDLTNYALNILGGSFSQFFNTEAGETTHGWQPTDIQYVLDNI